MVLAIHHVGHLIVLIQRSVQMWTSQCTRRGRRIRRHDDEHRWVRVPRRKLNQHRRAWTVLLIREVNLLELWLWPVG